MVRDAIRAGFIEMYRMTLNDRTDFERSPKPNGTPILPTTNSRKLFSSRETI